MGSMLWPCQGSRSAHSPHTPRVTREGTGGVEELRPSATSPGIWSASLELNRKSPTSRPILSHCCGSHLYLSLNGLVN